MMMRLLEGNKSALIVALIVFSVLIFGAPRLAKVPRFATPEGRLSLLGAIAISLVAGGLFKVSTLVT